MDLISILFIVIGLALFETISSIDNAVINAEVLGKMSLKARKWFLTFGLLIAVFIVRGILPLLIVWLANPSMSLQQIFASGLDGDSIASQAIDASAPLLLIAGGIFLLFLFMHWLFLEPKNFGLRGERLFQSQGVWFYAIVSILLTVLVWFASQKSALMAFAAVVGSTAFFITHGFKQNAEEHEKHLLHTKSGGEDDSKAIGIGDISKLLYLEVIDATFSIDGVVGAFAFTLSVALILIGNGIGAFVVRELTLHNIDKVKRYIYLKNGAMYSILFLSIFMVLQAFGYSFPHWLSPAITFVTIGFFYWKSELYLKAQAGIV